MNKTPLKTNTPNISIYFKIGDKLIKECLPNYLHCDIKAFSYKISEKYKIQFRKILQLVQEQINYREEKLRLKNIKETEEKETEEKNENLGKKHQRIESEERYIYSKDNLIDIHSDKAYNSIENSNIDEINRISKIDSKMNDSKLSKRVIKEYKKTKTYEFHNSFTRIKNLGDRVYQKSLIELERRKKNAERIKAERDKEELKETKIRPVKTEYSTLLNFKLHFDLISNDRKRIRKMNTKTKSETKSPNVAVSSKSNNFTGFSYINSEGDFAEEENGKYRRTIIKSPEEVKQITERLYRHSEIRENKINKLVKEYYRETCPFKPEINHDFHGPAESKENIETQQTQQTKSDEDILSKPDFLQRVYQWKDKIKQQHEEKKHLSTQVNLTTGEALFNPSAYRSSSVSAVIAKLQEQDKYKEKIHERLYKEHEELKAKIQEENKRKEDFIKRNSVMKASETNKSLTETTRANLFEEIYKLFNPEEHEQIIINDEYLASLPLDDKLKSQLSGLFNAMKNPDSSLTKEDFIAKTQEVYSKLLFDDRRKVNDWYTDKMRTSSPRKLRQEKQKMEDEHKFSFKPYVSQSSIDIVTKGKKFSGTSFNERNSLLINKRDSYVSEQAILNATNMMKECSFKPNLEKNHYVSQRGSIIGNINEEKEVENEVEADQNPEEIQHQESSV